MDTLTIAIGLAVFLFVVALLWIVSNPVRIPGADTAEQKDIRAAWGAREQPSREEIDQQTESALAETRRYVYRDEDWR